MRSYKFTSIGQILQFYVHCNPARQKAVNFFEPESKSSRESWAIEIARYDGTTDSLDGPESLWILIRIILNKTLRQYDKSSNQVKAFTLCYLLPPEEQMHVLEIAEGHYPPHIPQHLRIPCISKTTLYKYLREIKEDLERACRVAYLLPPDK